MIVVDEEGRRARATDIVRVNRRLISENGRVLLRLGQEHLMIETMIAQRKRDVVRELMKQLERNVDVTMNVIDQGCVLDEKSTVFTIR